MNQLRTKRPFYSRAWSLIDSLSRRNPNSIITHMAFTSSSNVTFQAMLVRGIRIIIGYIVATMNTNKRIRNKKATRGTRRRPRQAKNESTMMIMPAHIRRKLRYVDSAYVRNNPGNNFLVYAFRVNDLYDPDPTILSGSLSGFKELMQFYAQYRVLHLTASVTIINLETFPIMYGMCFSTNNLTGVIATRDDAINALENHFSTKAHILSGKGGIDRAKLSRGEYMHKIVGDKKQYLSEIEYSGLGLATPARPVWLNFIVASTTGAALTNGYATTTNLIFDSEFYGLLNLRA